MSQRTVPRPPAPERTEESPPPRPRGTPGRRWPRRRRRAPRLPGGIGFRHKLRRDCPLILMTLPALLLLIVFAYVPIAFNVIAFEFYTPYAGDGVIDSLVNSAWVGLENFQRMVGDSQFWLAVRNTLTFSSLQLIFYFPIPIALALLINSFLHSKVRAWAQAVLYLPHFFSWVLVITIFQQILGGAGLFSQLLREYGYDAGLDLMTDPGFFKWLITLQVIWKDAGWGTIVFLAALSTINQELYESAAVDGAGRWRRMWHVTLPALRPVIALLLVLQVGNMLTIGSEQFLIQRTAVGVGASEVLDSYIWDRGIANGDYSYAATIGIVKGVFSLVLVLGANRVAHAMGEQGLYQRQ